jgi:hypothetical protein
MSTFEQWNDAIIQYFTDGERDRAAIFLDISEERLTEIGLLYLNEGNSNSPDWARDFKSAVRSKCTKLNTNGEREVHLYHIASFDIKQVRGKPKGVAFLALMALAAHNMVEDEEAADHNYFKRLRQLLNIPGNKRPPGMMTEDEERLWHEWELWLLREGFTVTARPGKGPQQYVGYPLSQPLLRQADREHLFKHFNERSYPAGLDQARLGGRLRRDARYIRGNHLRELLGNGGTQRLEAVNLALFEVYREWLEAGRPAKPATYRLGGVNRPLFQNLDAGIYRKVGDVFSGEVNYYVYPLQPRRIRIEGVPQVIYQGESGELEVERSGWYWPLWDWPLKTEDLDKGVKYELKGIAPLRELVLPARDFWLLVEDPDCPTNNLYATWQDNADLGTSFILLCKTELKSQLQQLKDDERLIWQGQPRTISNLPGWLEYIGVQVISENWGAATIENKDLFEALRPKTSLGLLLTGGLRLPERDSWLEGCGPQLTIVAFAEKANIEIRAINTQAPKPTVLRNLAELGSVLNLMGSVDLGEVATNKPMKVEWPGAGKYVIEVNCGTDFLAKTLTIQAWQNLELSPVEALHKIGLQIGASHLVGPLVEEAHLP